MQKVHHYRSFLLLTMISISAVSSLYEGDVCYHEAKQKSGVCKLIEQCQEAIEDLKNRIRPKNCGFIKDAAIVCCVERETATSSIVTEKVTTPKPLTSSTEKATTTKPTAPSTETTSTSQPDRRVPGAISRQKCLEYEELGYKIEISPSLFPEDELIKIDICPWQKEPAITGGTKCTQGEFPHMALVKYGSRLRCGGTLISEKFVLTAGHCINEDAVPTMVRLGDLNITNSNDDQYVQERKIKRIHVHPGYTEPIQYNDLALLELERDVELNAFLKPACLYTKDPVNIVKALVTGWGLTEDHVFSDHLLRAGLDVFTKEDCARKFNHLAHIFPNGIDYTIELCAGSFTGNKDTCGGDSGGPLQIYATDVHCSHYIIGVTSFGLRCGEVNSPAVYTRVYPYLQWIEDIVWPK